MARQEENISEFGKRLIKLFAEKGIDINNPSERKAAAEAWGISDRTMQSYLEKNNQNPRYDNIKEMCKYFGCSADYLLLNIPCATHQATDAHEYTGLSETALKKLRGLSNEVTIDSNKVPRSEAKKHLDEIARLRSEGFNIIGLDSCSMWDNPEYQTFINKLIESDLFAAMGSLFGAYLSYIDDLKAAKRHDGSFAEKDKEIKAARADVSLTQIELVDKFREFLENQK